MPCKDVCLWAQQLNERVTVGDRRKVCKSVWVHMSISGRMYAECVFCSVRVYSIMLNLHSIAVIDIETKATLEGSVCFSLQVNPPGKDGRGGTQSRTWEQAVTGLFLWLASPSVLSYLSSTAQVHVLKHSPAHSGLAPPSSIVMKTRTQDMTTGHLTGTVPQLRFLLLS